MTIRKMGIDNKVFTGKPVLESLTSRFSREKVGLGKESPIIGEESRGIGEKDTVNIGAPGKPEADRKTDTAAPKEFLDLMKRIPPWKNVKVFLVHGSHTGGHRSAAESVKKALDEIPNVQAEVINALDYSGGETVKNLQVGTADLLIKKWGNVRSWFFKKSFEGNPIIYWLGKQGMKIKAWMSKSFLNKIKEEKPDVILCTHSPMNAMFSYWKGKGEIDMPVHSVVTDYKVHRMWAHDNIDHYYVASEQAKGDLVKFGVDKSKIEITGIPIKPDFAKPTRLSKTELREKLGIDPQLPTVLMMGGSLGLGRFGDVASALNSLKTPVQIVCITGKNEAKKAELEELQKQLKMPMKVLGYTKNVDEWMSACDMIVSKPGGLTTSEIFAKNIPMIILDPAPGLEELLIPSIEATGAAFRVDTPKDAAGLIEQIINDPSKKENVMRNLEKVGKPLAAYAVGKDLVERVIMK